MTKTGISAADAASGLARHSYHGTLWLTIWIVFGTPYTSMHRRSPKNTVVSFALKPQLGLLYIEDRRPPLEGWTPGFGCARQLVVREYATLRLLD
jgi:hypothetical protein